jgi:hypothetical protein
VPTLKTFIYVTVQMLKTFEYGLVFEFPTKKPLAEKSFLDQKIPRNVSVAGLVNPTFAKEFPSNR